jgi:hypothetical protein
MKFKTIEGQPKFRITLTGEEAEWLHGHLDYFECDPNGAKEPKCDVFIESLREEIAYALCENDLTPLSWDEVIDEDEECAEVDCDDDEEDI